MSDGSVVIMIGGEAGQGLVTIGELLAKSLVRCGYHIVVTQSYESRIRGGHNTFVIRTSAGGVSAPADRVDILVALNAETVARHQTELGPGGLVLTEHSVSTDCPGQCLKMPLDRLAGEPLYENTAALGVLAGLLGLDMTKVHAALAAHFGHKDPEVGRRNRKALDAGYAFIESRGVPFPKLPSIGNHPDRLMLNANQAIGLGALASGANFCSFYPMTPATSVALTIIAHAEELGVIVEQAEDEIAAVNMAIGASYAGARVIVPTSGGGFALMTEGVSLAGMTETPLVLVVAMRPGPATGLPTRTEQADLDLVLHAGHGEFPRAIFAPGTVQEFFHLTCKAFDLAERFQTPVFVLSDQYMADSYRAVVPFDLDSLPPLSGPDLGDGAPESYKRYALTPDGVSPRRIPALGRSLVVLDSDEHYPDGHITEDLDVRVAMHDKRLRKAAGLAAACVPPTFLGDPFPEILLVCWGSTFGPAEEAATLLRAEGRKAAVLHFSQVWPLPSEAYLPYLQAARLAVSVEGNATAQLAGLIRKESGFAITRHVLRYDGLPFTPGYIHARILDLLRNPSGVA